MYTEEQKQIRQSLKTIERATFLKSQSKADLIGRAEALGADLEDAKTKDDIYDAMIVAARLPNPALRGRSTTESPVAFVWMWLDERREAIQAGELRRKDAVAQLQDAGIAYYTARTQFQAWFSGTSRGERAVGDLDVNELPRVMRPSEEDES